MANKVLRSELMSTSVRACVPSRPGFGAKSLSRVPWLKANRLNNPNHLRPVPPEDEGDGDGAGTRRDLHTNILQWWATKFTHLIILNPGNMTGQGARRNGRGHETMPASGVEMEKNEAFGSFLVLLQNTHIMICKCAWISVLKCAKWAG